MSTQKLIVRGCFELFGDPNDYETKDGIRKCIIPYPEKQVKVAFPVLGMHNDLPGLSFDIYQYSLPRCEHIINEAMKILSEKNIEYFLSQLDDISSSSDTLYDYEKSVVEERIFNMYKNQKYFDYYLFDTKEEFFKECNVYINEINYCDSLLLLIRDEVIDEKTDTFVKKLLDSIKYLNKNDIYITEGSLEWSDTFEYNKKYSFDMEHESYTLTELNTETNEQKILFSINEKELMKEGK